MLPQQSSKTVFINPDFKQTHINPNFLKLRTPNSIHVNPNFFQTPNIAGHTSKLENQQSKIIKKTRTKLVREIVAVPTKSTIHSASPSPLIKIGQRKLIRACLVNKNDNNISPILPQSKIIKKNYKIDRRVAKTLPTKLSYKRKHFITRYALSRTSVNEALMPKEVVVGTRKMLKIGSRKFYTNGQKFSNSTQPEGKIKFLNINGVFYKLSKNKLQKAQDFKVPPTKSYTGRVIFVKGDKFVLDKSGRSLTRVQNPENMKLQRIDIGGITYIAKSANVFVRTNVHKVRNHLSSAKQKSINILSRNLVKTNTPCPIFRKVGKCAAFERAKCPKVHDKKQVAICPKFLKGECTIKDCLLSHEVTLSKMPTCKFFLQGCCVRNECPYLHKKVNEKTEVCFEFLRGFCLLAEKCNKRHDFEWPNSESKKTKINKPKTMRTSNNKVQKAREAEQKCNTVDKSKEKLTTSKDKIISRYFGEELNNSDSVIGNVENEHSNNDSLKVSWENIDDLDYNESNTLRKRPKLGQLPSFIPL